MAKRSARRRLLALSILAIAALLTGLGVGAAYGYEQGTSENPIAAESTTETTDGGLTVNAVLGVTAFGMTIERELEVDPPVARSVDLPGLSVHREDTADLPVSTRLDLDIASGSHVTRTSGDQRVETAASSTAVVSPGMEAATIAAAAFAGAGLVAYFWASLKAGIYKFLVLPLVPLYAHITRSEALDNRVRERIFEAIKAEPGVSASELARRTDVSWGTTMYHLDVLEQTKMISSMRDGRYRRYFQNGAGLTATKQVVAILRNPITERVATCVETTPGVTQKDLAAAMDMSPQALHWHLTRLVKAGVVEKRREGRLVRHFALA